MSPLASELEVVEIPPKSSWEGKGGRMKKMVSSPAVDEEDKSYPVTRNVVKGSLVRMN